MIQLSFEFHKAADTRGMNTTEPWLGVCVLKTQGVFCNLFLFCFIIEGDIAMMVDVGLQTRNLD